LKRQGAPDWTRVRLAVFPLWSSLKSLVSATVGGGRDISHFQQDIEQFRADIDHFPRDITHSGSVSSLQLLKRIRNRPRRSV